MESCWSWKLCPANNLKDKSAKNQQQKKYDSKIILQKIQPLSLTYTIFKQQLNCHLLTQILGLRSRCSHILCCWIYFLTGSMNGYSVKILKRLDSHRNTEVFFTFTPLLFAEAFTHILKWIFWGVFQIGGELNCWLPLWDKKYSSSLSSTRSTFKFKHSFCLLHIVIEDFKYLKTTLVQSKTESSFPIAYKKIEVNGFVSPE